MIICEDQLVAARDQSLIVVLATVLTTLFLCALSLVDILSTVFVYEFESIVGYIKRNSLISRRHSTMTFLEESASLC